MHLSLFPTQLAAYAPRQMHAQQPPIAVAIYAQKNENTVKYDKVKGIKTTIRSHAHAKSTKGIK